MRTILIIFKLIFVNWYSCSNPFSIINKVIN